MRTYIQKKYGEKYVPEKPRIYLAKQKLAQEAHEGIRPTKIQIERIDGNREITNDHMKLYELIWKRAVASQMSDSLIESTTVFADSTSKENIYRFKTTGSVLLFDGFLKLTPFALQDRQLPQFTTGESLLMQKCFSTPHESLPPPRYNEASLIAALEEKGIGRPSTYASIITTLIDRTYVERVEKRFEPTPIGKAVTDFLVTNFSTIDDIPFTAEMEDKLDSIAQGKKEWVSMMSEFYQPFEKKISEAEGLSRIKIETTETSEICPQCGASLVVRYGKFGKFISCSKFPDCKFTKQYVEETDALCPNDNGKIIVKKTRKGRKFFGCSNYPTCNFATWKLEDIKKTKSP
jgi:DNA topoisomerase-1